MKTERVDAWPRSSKAVEVNPQSGCFTLSGGYPEWASLAALYDELDCQRAVQANSWAAPAVEMEVLAKGLARDLGLSLTTVGIFENILDAKTLEATGRWRGACVVRPGSTKQGSTSSRTSFDAGRRRGARSASAG